MKLARTLMVLLTLGFGPSLGADGLSAHDSVRQAMDLLLRTLVEAKPIYTEDPEKFFEQVDGALSPYIDFDRFSRGVMAKHYRKATPEQRERFKDIFKQDLMRTYAKALVAFDNEKVEVLPPGKKKPKRPDERAVKMEIHGKSGAIYPIQYSMVRSGGDWKLKNVIVEGINIGLAFRNKFAESMDRNRRDIDKVIEAWNSGIGSET
jgi:phospholipid transport system substrate-binding protein